MSRLRQLPTQIARGWDLLRAALRGGLHDFTEGKIEKAIFLLAVPMVLELGLESVFAVADIFFVGRLGPSAIVAIGITESLITVIYAIGIGLAMATTALVARRIGEKEDREASHTSAQALLLGGVASILVAVPGAWFAPELLAAMGAAPDVVAMGSSYARILLASNGVILILFLANAAFRGAGDASIAMRVLWLANGLNLILDPCLIFGLGPFPELGLTGAAVATSIGRGVAVICQLVLLFRGSGRLKVRLSDFVPNLALLRRLVSVSIGGIGQSLIGMASWIALMRLVASFGTAAVAGYTIAIRIVIFALLPSWGMSNAAATLVGQNLGAQKPDRAERSVWLTGRYNMIFLSATMILFLLFARALVNLFTPDPTVQEFGVAGLVIISWGFPFYAWGMVLVQSFNGAGDTATPTWVNLVCFWLFQIPFAWLLAVPAGLGPRGVFASVAAAYSLSAMVGAVLFRRGSWKGVRV